MNRILHFKQTDEQKTYVCSDTHLNHNNPRSGLIWKNRGYPDSKSHTSAVIDGINARVRANDNLVHFGDFCLNTSESELNELLSRIVCQNIYMVWGNHNNPLWALYRKEVQKVQEACGFLNYTGCGECEIYPFRYRNVIFIGNYLEMSIDGHYFIGSHYPMYVFNYMKDSAMHLCGHSHYSLPFSTAEDDRSKILDVGWDGRGDVYSLQQILDIMGKKKVFGADHHVKFPTQVPPVNQLPKDYKNFNVDGRL
jgi:calcineurin-like phosphoesterase family protein